MELLDIIKTRKLCKTYMILLANKGKAIKTELKELPREKVTILASFAVFLTYYLV